MIENKFPESGHSYMDSDRDFGQIKKIVKKIENIYSVDEYQDIMGQSQNVYKPHVVRMADKLFQINDFPKLLNLVNRNHNTAGELVKFRDRIRRIRVDKQS